MQRITSMLMTFCLTVYFCIGIVTDAYSAEAKTVTGYPMTFRDAGMHFIRLEDKNGKEIVFLGSEWEIEENNKKAYTCLSGAVQNHPVTVSGELKKDTSGETFDIKTLTCVPATEKQNNDRAASKLTYGNISWKVVLEILEVCSHLQQQNLPM